MNLLHDAIRSILPAKSRSAPYNGGTRIKFDCPLCHLKGHSRDTRQRGAFFLSPDGSAGYDCLQCQTRTRQPVEGSLNKKMQSILEFMGMPQNEIFKLSYALWSNKILRERGIAPRPHIAKQPLPAGAKPIGEWIADNIADENFNDLLENLADMTDALRDSYYWTPDAGPSGDMNRRYIWVIGPKDDPMGWAALTIDDEEAEPLQSDPNIFLINDEDDQ